MTKTTMPNKFLQFENNSFYQYALLAVITLIAVALRFYKLGDWSFWWDEMYTLRDAAEIFDEGFGRKPLTFILVNLATNNLGISEWSARLAPALIGIASIPILYFPIKKMVGASTALIAALLLAIAPWHLYWSQNARFYSALLLFCTLALLAFYFALEEDRPWYLILSLFFLGLAANERLSGLLVVPVIVSYLALLIILPFEKPPGLRPRNLILFFLPGLIGSLFFAGPFFQQPSRWVAAFGWVNNSPVWILAGVFFYVGIPTICLAALGAVYQLTRKDRAALLLSLGAVVPLLLIMALSLIQYTANRYIFISLTSWIILASVAARELLWQTEKSVKYLAVGALAILVLVPLSENGLYYVYQNGNRDDWKSAFTYVKQQQQEGDLIVVTNSRIGDFYMQENTIMMLRADLAQIEAGNNKVWFVEDLNGPQKWPHVHSWLQDNAQLEANMDVHVRGRNFRMRIYLYEPAVLLVDDQVSR